MVENDIPSVMEVIAKRVKEGSKPKDRDDPWTVYLVGESGAMTGLVIGAGRVAMQRRDVFLALDGFLGNSAGSCADVYSLSNKTEIGASIFYEDLVNNFIRYRNLLSFSNRRFKPRELVDIDYLTYHVMASKEKRFDFERVVSSGVDLRVLVTSAKDAKTEVISHFRSFEHLLNVVNWSCRIPVIGGMPVKVFDQGVEKYYCDGGTLAGSIPLQFLPDEVTHVLVQRARPDRVSRISKIIELIYTRLVPSILSNEGFRALANDYKFGSINYYKALGKINLSFNNPNVLPRIQVISANDFELNKLERDPKKLFRGAQYGFDITDSFLANYGIEVADHSLKLIPLTD